MNTLRIMFSLVYKNQSHLTKFLLIEKFNYCFREKAMNYICSAYRYRHKLLHWEFANEKPSPLCSV